MILTFKYQSIPSQLKSNTALLIAVLDTLDVMVSVVAAGNAPNVVVEFWGVSIVITHTGLLANAVPNVILQVEEALDPSVALPMPFAPTTDGLVPQTLIVCTVPVVFNSPLSVVLPVKSVSKLAPFVAVELDISTWPLVPIPSTK